MELMFLGTRGEIEIRSHRHRRHSVLLIERDGDRIMIDCGADWLRRLRPIAPTAIVLTHAHADHAAGLVKGAPCPVYATAATWRLLARLAIRDRRTRCRFAEQCALAACSFAPSRCSIPFALLPWAIESRRTVAASFMCRMLPNCPGPPKSSGGLISILVTARPYGVQWFAERTARWSDMLLLCVSLAGARRHTFDAPSSPIVGHHSCAPARVQLMPLSASSGLCTGSMFKLRAMETACRSLQRTRFLSISREHQRPPSLGNCQH